MKSKFNHRVIYLSIFLIFIPFVLINNIYPLMRLGMFAEPVHKQDKIELYYLKSKVRSGERVELDETDTRISKSTLNYLIRNHIARNEADLLSQKLMSNPLISKMNEVEVWKRVIQDAEVREELVITLESE